MRTPHGGKALAALMRVAILGITQGVATLIAVMLFLMRCPADLIMVVLLVFAICGIVVGDRATRPRR